MTDTYDAPATIGEERLVSSDLLAEPLDVDDGSIVLKTTSRMLTAPVGEPTAIGLWEAGPGTDVDIEVDEVFLVLSGEGTVTFDDASSIPLRRGTLVRLLAGDRTTWVITQRLRKLYIL